MDKINKNHFNFKILYLLFLKQHIDVGFLLNEAARNRLKRLFNQLDTDRDGYEYFFKILKISI